MNTLNNDAIAIIGIACRFGNAKNAKEFWDDLANGIESIHHFNEEELYEMGHDATLNQPNFVPYGVLLPNAYSFDAEFFDYNPQNAELIDPQQRLLLESAWAALEDAGYVPNQCPQTGVYVSLGQNYHSQPLKMTDLNSEGFLTYTANEKDFAATRISYKLNLKGPSFNVQTACSSSLVAVHLACESLINNECNMAIAGGVSLHYPQAGYFHQKNMILSDDGHCRPFSINANGTVFGNGVGIIVLKRLAEAIQDKDHIYAIIKGSAVNNDGSNKVDYYAPSKNGQCEVISEALAIAQIDPTSIGYIEAHATGTTLGDPIEIEALSQVFSQYTNKTNYCALGSVKSNIGHMNTAAGIASLIKTALILKHRAIPPTLHFTAPNPKIDFSSTPFFVNTELLPWNTNTSRNAGVSSFGIGGTNVHMILEEYIDDRVACVSNKINLFTLSAKNSQALNHYAKQLYNYIFSTSEEISMDDLAYTLQISRSQMKCRLAILAKDKTDLIHGLDCFLKNEKSAYVFMQEVNNIANYFGQDEEDIHYLKVLLNEGKLTKIAQIWLQGANIRWEALNIGQRLSLPTYPFVRKIWPTPLSTLKNKYIAAIQQDQYYSLILNEDSKNIVSFERLIDAQMVEIKEHEIANQKILPAVLYFEIVRALIKQAFNQDTYQFNHIVWYKPIIVNTEKKIILTLQLIKEVIHVSIYSNENNEKITHAQLVLNLNIFEQNILELNTVEIKKRCHSHLDKEPIYAYFRQHDVNYGPSYQILNTIFYNDEEVLSSWSLVNKEQKINNQGGLSTVVLDGALQSILGFFIQKKLGKHLNIPFSLEKIGWTSYFLPNNGFVYIQQTKNIREDSDLKKFNLFLLDSKGKVLVEFKNFVLRAVAPISKAINKMNYFKSLWLKKDRQIDRQQKYFLSSLLVFADNQESFLEFQKTNEKKFEKIIWIKQGNKFSINDLSQVTINPNEISDYKQLWHILHEKNIIISHIIYLFENNKVFEFFEFERALEPFVLLAKSLIEIKKSHNTSIIYLYSLNNVASCWQNSIISLGRTLKIENPQLSISTMGFEPNTDFKIIVEQALTEVIQANGKIMDIRYVNGQRHQLYYENINLLKDKTIKKYLRHKGKYLITGGLGHIGWSLAHFLLTQYQAHVFLVGRSELKDKKAKQFQDLQKLGSKVQYYTLDVNDKVAMQNLLNLITVQEQSSDVEQSLQGIFHCAGIRRDEFLLRKNTKDFKEVLNTKIESTLILDEITKHITLDFFCLFSSISGVFGNMGQSDYAMANCFLDKFAEYRNELSLKGQRFGKTLAIDWPLWENENNETELKTRLLAKGLEPLPIALGLQAIDEILNSNVQDSLMIIYGVKEKLQEQYSDWFFDNTQDSFEEQKNSNIPSNHLIPEKIHSSSSSEKDLKFKTLNYLAKALAEVTKYEKTSIEENTHFSAYNIDSLAIMEINQSLEKDFGALSKTLLFEYQTLAELTDYFLKHHHAQLSNLFNELKSFDKNETTNESPLEFSDINKNVLVPQKDNTLYQPEIISEVNTNNDSFSIAIIGMAGRYPEAENLKEFWLNLTEGKDCITEIPADRWNLLGFYDPDKNKYNTSFSKWGGFIKDIDKFDNQLFNISPREASIIDPQARLFLEISWQTLEDAGYTADNLIQREDELSKRDIGVFVGVMYGDYQLHEAEERLKGYPILANSSYWSIANRVSYFFDFQGPSVAVDTACSSALSAIHLACNALIQGDCKVALAGGVNLSLHPNKYFMLSQGRFAASDGRCKSFGANGDGYVPSEGVGAVLLKPLKEAIKDKDHIYGIIRGSAMNHGGKTNGYTVPNPNAQANLIKKAWNKAAIDPATINYIEAHGTGTALGDPIEIRALTKAFQQKNLSGKNCAIGSVKSNVGHLESAAGIVALTKVLLQIKNKTLVPTIHAEIANPEIAFSKTPFYLQKESSAWNNLQTDTGQKLPLRAGISSFGAGGANAHMIIEEFIENSSPKINSDDYLIVLSARNKDLLLDYVKSLYEFFSEQKNINLSDISYTLLVGRVPMTERIAIITNSIADLINKLQTYILHKKTKFLFVKGEQSYELSVYDEENKLQGLIQQAVHWLDGHNLELNKLFKEPANRLALPTRPFLRNRCWYDIQIEHLAKQGYGNSDVEKLLVNHYRNIGNKETIKKTTLEPLMLKNNEQAPNKKLKLRLINTSNTSSKNTQKIIEDKIPSSKIELVKIHNHVIDEHLSQPNEIQNGLREKLAEILYLEPDKINETTTFNNLGVDSILGVEFINFINKTYQLDMKATVLYDYSNIFELAKYINDNSNKHQHLPEIKEEISNYTSKNEINLLTSVEHSLESIKTLLCNWLSEALYLTLEAINLEHNFNDLGLDSILSVEFINNINSKFQLKEKASILYDYSTINSLASYLFRLMNNASFAKNEKSTLEVILDSLQKNEISIDQANQKILTMDLINE